MPRSIRVATIIALALCLMMSTASVASAVSGYRIATDGRCANIRTGPGFSFGVIKCIANGTAIDITCQTRGDLYNGSTMWDRLAALVTGFVHDNLTNTPVFNDYTPGIPRCDNPPPPPPPPPPGKPAFALQSIEVRPLGQSAFTLGSGYRFKFVVKNIGSASGTATLGLQESGDYSHNDRGGIGGPNGAWIRSTSRSATLSPGQSTDFLFVGFHRWDWVDPGTSSLSKIFKAISVAETLTTCSADLKNVSAFKRLTKLGQYLHYGEKGLKYFDVLHELSEYASAWIRSSRSFTYAPSSDTSGGLSFSPIPVTLGIPDYKAAVFLKSIAHQYAAKALACAGWLAVRNKLAGSPIGATLTIGSGVLAATHIWASSELYRAAWDPVPDYSSVQQPQQRELKLVREFPDGSIKDYLEAATDIGEYHEAISEAQVRYAAAVEDQAFDAAALQAAADNGFALGIADRMQDDAVKFQDLVDLVPRLATVEDDRTLLAELKENGLPDPIEETLRELGFGDEDLASLKDSWLIEPPDERPEVDLKEELALWWNSTLTTTLDLVAGSADRLGAAKVETGVPSTSISIAGSEGQGGWFRESPTLTLAPAPESVAVSRMDYSLNGGETWQKYEGPVSLAHDGRYDVRARAVSAAGLLEVPAQAAHALVDGLAPVTTDNAPSTWQNRPFIVVLNGTDATSGVGSMYYSTDGSDPSTVITGRGESVRIDAEGDYALRYYAIDNAGNAETVKRGPNRLRLDMTPPTSSVSRPNVPVFIRTVALEGAATDALSGVASVEVRFTNVITGAVSKRQAELGADKASWSLVSPMSIGVYDVTTVATDQAANRQVKPSQPVRIYVV